MFSGLLKQLVHDGEHMWSNLVLHKNLHFWLGASQSSHSKHVTYSLKAYAKIMRSKASARQELNLTFRVREIVIKALEIFLFWRVGYFPGRKKLMHFDTVLWQQQFDTICL